MLETCEEYALEFNVRFSTNEDVNLSKCKALYVTGSRKAVKTPEPLILDGKPLPWVSRCEHLGHILSSSGTMEDDARRARASFIDAAVKLRECFSFAHPEEIIFATEKYASSFYGSNLWDLQCRTAEMVYASWRTSVKFAWNLLLTCKSMFIDFLAPSAIKPEVSLLSRFVAFSKVCLIAPAPKFKLWCVLVRVICAQMLAEISHTYREKLV